MVCQWYVVSPQVFLMAINDEYLFLLKIIRTPGRLFIRSRAQAILWCGALCESRSSWASYSRSCVLVVAHHKLSFTCIQIYVVSSDYIINCTINIEKRASQLSTDRNPPCQNARTLLNASSLFPHVLNESKKYCWWLFGGKVAVHEKPALRPVHALINLDYALQPHNDSFKI